MIFVYQLIVVYFVSAVVDSPFRLFASGLMFVETLTPPMKTFPLKSDGFLGFYFAGCSASPQH